MLNCIIKYCSPCFLRSDLSLKIPRNSEATGKGGFNILWMHLATHMAICPMNGLLPNMQQKQLLYSLQE